jgi:hypothetical protein
MSTIAIFAPFSFSALTGPIPCGASAKRLRLDLQAGLEGSSSKFDQMFKLEKMAQICGWWPVICDLVHRPRICTASLMLTRMHAQRSQARCSMNVVRPVLSLVDKGTRFVSVASLPSESALQSRAPVASEAPNLF